MYTFPNLQPVHCSMSVFKCCFLTCIQISQEAGKVVWYSLPFKNSLQFIVIHTVNGFGAANKGNIYIFFFFCVEFSLSLFFFFSMMQWKLIFGSSVFSKFSLNFWKVLSTSESSQYKYCWSLGWENFEHYFASV